MLAETAPSCNDCVATIVARLFTTTMKDRNQTSGDEKSVLFPLIQESGGVSGLRESVDPPSTEMMIFIYYTKTTVILPIVVALFLGVTSWPGDTETQP